MARKVLYREYRPTSLDNVIGQSQVTDALKNSLAQGKIGHAYLFIGPRGTGKTSVARIFAHAVNGFSYNVEDNYLDIIEIDAASNTGVDNIRELREKAIIAPTQGQYKVYIIDEVHMLTKSASNALLKTLEEPPEHVIFIMATTDAHKVPITISSRTQVFTFKLADADTMQAHLRKISDQEHIDITDDALALVVRRGGGSFRDSLSILDQVSTLSSEQITADFLSHALGLPQEQTVQNLLQAYAEQNHAQIQLLLKDLLNTGIKPEIIASELIDQIIKDPQSAWLNLLGSLPDVQPPFPEAKLLLSLLSDTTVPARRPAFTAISTSYPTTSPRDILAQKIAAQKTKATTPLKKPSVPPPSKDTTDAVETVPTTEDTTPELVSHATSANSETTTATNDDFNWESFIDTVNEANEALALQLKKAEYELIDVTLHLYPLQKFTKSILERPANHKILLDCLPGYEIILHEIGGKPKAKDDTLSQISAIMGNVREVNGDLPF